MFIKFAHSSIDKERTTDDDGTIRQKNIKYYPIWQTNIYLEGNFGDFGLGFSPDLLSKINQIGFKNTSVVNLFNGIVAIHQGFKVFHFIT